VSTTIPFEGVKPPIFRVLVADSFGCNDVSGDPSKSTTTWTAYDQPNSGNGMAGMQLSTISRRSLPEIGEAYFMWEYGVFPHLPSDRIPAPPDLAGKEVRLQLSNDNGTTWKTVFWGTVFTQEDNANIGGLGDGRAVVPDSSAGAFGGRMVYRCLDGFARTMKWMLNRHGYDPNPANPGGFGPAVKAEVVGHPGYNYYVNADVALLGNKSQRLWERQTYATGTRGPIGSVMYSHCWQGAFAASQTDNNILWTDLEALVNCLNCVRPNGEPQFILREGTDGYEGYNPWPVNPNTSVYDLVIRICRRSRGRGVVGLKWIDNPDGSLSVYLGVTPINHNNITYNDIRSGVGYTITGNKLMQDYGDGHKLSYRDSRGIVTNYWDLVGDSRNIDNLFYWEKTYNNIYDAVETTGEQIEVTATISLGDTVDGMAGIYDHTKQVALAPRWSGQTDPVVGTVSDDVTKMYSFVVSQYWAPRFRNVYQAFGLPYSWNFTIGDAKGGVTPLRCDYRCVDDGRVSAPGLTNYQDTSQGQVELTATLPFFENWDYSTGLAKGSRYDSVNANGMPNRRTMLVLARLNSTGDKWFYTDIPQGQADANQYWAKWSSFNPQVHVAADQITCVGINSESGRMFGDLAYDAAHSGQLNVQFDVSTLAFTLTMIMPHRLRFMSAAAGSPLITDVLSPMNGQVDTTRLRRIRTVHVPGAHLWLAHPYTIWDLDFTTQDDNGVTAKRLPLNAAVLSNVPAILRDDRGRVQRAHLIAKEWYLNIRSRLRVGQQFCGIMPYLRNNGLGGTFTDVPPTLNDYIPTIYANADVVGAGYNISTIVTQVDYDHQANTTIWTTDYFDIEPGE